MLINLIYGGAIAQCRSFCFVCRRSPVPSLASPGTVEKKFPETVPAIANSTEQDGPIVWLRIRQLPIFLLFNIVLGILTLSVSLVFRGNWRETLVKNHWSTTYIMSPIANTEQTKLGNWSHKKAAAVLSSLCPSTCWVVAFQPSFPLCCIAMLTFYLSINFHLLLGGVRIERWREIVLKSLAVGEAKSAPGRF